MRQRRESDGSVLVPDGLVFLDELRQFVNERGFAGCGQNWGEVVRTFADDHAFLDFSARRYETLPRVLIEFGVHASDERHVVGFVDTFWDVAQEDFLRIEAIVVDGEMLSIDELAVALASHLNLPMVAVDVVMLAEAA